VNYNDEHLIRFINDYSERHNTVPATNGFAFIGFDIAYFYLNELLIRGVNFDQNLILSKGVEGLQTIFQFDQIQAFSGYENKGLYFIRYDNYELVKVGDNRRRSEINYLIREEPIPNDSIPSGQPLFPKQ
jgi:hypothetical protein